MMEGLNLEAMNPWVLAIEALLHMKEVDICVILELIKSVPDVSDEFGGNARELLSIRILEDLYAREVHKGNSSVPPPGSSISIDPSYSCEDVLNSLLKLTSPLNLRFDVAHILQLDVPSFITEKRSGIQNCFLHQMKNGILEGSNPIFKKLKDRSGLEVPDDNNGIPVDLDVSNGIIADRPGVPENTKPKRKLASLIVESDDISEENLEVENEKLSFSKRDKSVVVANNCEVVSPKPCGKLEESLKRLKRDLLCLPKELSASLCQHEQLGNPSSRTVESVDEPLHWETGPMIQSMEKSRGTEDDASARPNSIDVADISVDLQCQQQDPCVRLTPEKRSGENDGHLNCSDKANGGNECALELLPVAGNVGDDNIEENVSTEANDTVSPRFQNNLNHDISQNNNVHGDNLEISSDSDEHHDVRNDIAMMKNSFLSSQGMDTQDSLGTQLNSCVKCNKNGNLLVCSSSSCPLLVHQECLGSATDFNRMGNFYCPFCAYSQAISRYQEAKKKFSLRRADLRAFHVYRPELVEKSSTKMFDGSKKHGSSEIKKINGNIEPTNNHDALNKDIRSLIQISSLNAQVGTPCAENEKSLSRDAEIISGKEMHNQMNEKKEHLYQSDSDTTCSPQCTDTNAEKSSDAESEKTDTSRYCIRPRKQGRQMMEPSIQLRRKILPWTNVEEQTLKEGVRIFSSGDDKTIPWKKIWDYGADVFQKRRRPIDLKDKWRNICKGSPKIK